MITTARVLHALVGIVVLLITLSIVLRVAGGNPRNTIVSGLHDVGHFLVGPFSNVFLIKDPKASIAVNWGLAAVVYLVAGWLIAALIDRGAPRPAHRPKRSS